MRLSRDLGYAPALNDKAYETFHELREVTMDIPLEYLISLANKSADLGYPPAYCTLGILYSTAINLCVIVANSPPKTKQVFYNWFIKGAECGYIKGAECGHTEAQWRLGLCYLYGEGTERDVDEGLSWLTIASYKTYYVEAQFRLGDLLVDDRDYYSPYTKNEDLPSVEEGLQWYHLAAEQDQIMPPAFFALSLLHLTGNLALSGKDESKALELFQKGLAAENHIDDKFRAIDDAFQAACAHNHQHFIQYCLTIQTYYNISSLKASEERYNCLMVMAEIGMSMVLTLIEDFLPDDLVEELDTVIKEVTVKLFYSKFFYY